MVVFSLSSVQSTEKSSIENSTGSGNILSSLAKKEKTTVEHGQLLNEAFNQGISSFTPDLLYEHIVKNHSAAKQLFGPKLLRLLTGHSDSYLEKNIKIPEFRKSLKQEIESKIENLKKNNFLNKYGEINPQGVELASVMLAVSELDKLSEKGILPSKNKSLLGVGSVIDFRNFKKGDSYKDIAVRKSVRSAVKRSHKDIKLEDLRSKVRKSKGKVSVVYALDASASMKGEKISMAKRAGVALAYKAIDEKDDVGLVVFNQDVLSSVEICSDFQLLLENIVKISTSSQTDFSQMINKAIELFQQTNNNKHLIILTDALPNIGSNPEKLTLKAISQAKANDISISLVGINLDNKGKQLAEKIVEIGQGRLYLASNIKDLDLIVLEDYLCFS